MFARVGVGRTISFSNFEFSLQKKTKVIRDNEIHTNLKHKYLLIDSGRYIDLGERDMSREFR